MVVDLSVFDDVLCVMDVVEGLVDYSLLWVELLEG